MGKMVDFKCEYASYTGIDKDFVASLGLALPDMYHSAEAMAVYAKAVKEPHFLKENVAREGGFPSGTYDRSFYVIPDEYAAARTDYRMIINQELARLGDRQTRCIRLYDLKKEIRERGKR